jgi:recombination protein RecA
MSKKNIPDNNKEDKFAGTFSTIEKQFGKGSIMFLNSHNVTEIPSISTGSFALDMYLGIGGVPRGRITEIYGHEGSGKTTLALQTIAQAQKSGLTCAFIDTEHALNVEYAKQLGVEIDKLAISQPDSGEAALGILELLVKSGDFALIILDSVASLTPMAELEGEMGDSHIGLQARLMSQGLRKIVGHVSKNNVALIFINQTRAKIGISFPGASTETTTGGTSLKFYCSVRMEIKKIGTLFKMISGVKKIIGSRTLIKIVKNKFAPPFKEVKLDLIYGKGTSLAGEIFDLSVDKEYDFNLIQQTGSWYQYKGEKLGQGRDNIVIELQNNTSLMDKLKQDILDIHNNQHNIGKITNTPINENNDNNNIAEE